MQPATTKVLCAIRRLKYLNSKARYTDIKKQAELRDPLTNRGIKEAISKNWVKKRSDQYVLTPQGKTLLHDNEEIIYHLEDKDFLDSYETGPIYNPTKEEEIMRKYSGRTWTPIRIYGLRKEDKQKVFKRKIHFKHGNYTYEEVLNKINSDLHEQHQILRSEFVFNKLEHPNFGKKLKKFIKINKREIYQRIFRNRNLKVLYEEGDLRYLLAKVTKQRGETPLRDIYTFFEEKGLLKEERIKTLKNSKLFEKSEEHFGDFLFKGLGNLNQRQINALTNLFERICEGLKKEGWLEDRTTLIMHNTFFVEFNRYYEKAAIYDTTSLATEEEARKLLKRISEGKQVFS